MNGGGQTRILFVDDEPNVLNALERQLRGRFKTATATSGAEALDLMRDGNPFAVVVSDMRMPVMDGAAFLNEIRQEFPDTVRILLTGQSDLDSAIDAVNKGRIFRFLRKPCPSDQLTATLDDAVEHHRLVTAERILLSETLHGSIKTLTEILSLVSPLAFSRANRAKQIVSRVLKRLDVDKPWAIEVAAMLSQIGSVTLPPEVSEKIYKGAKLSGNEQQMLDRTPKVVEKLLANIPRLDEVREILRYQRKDYEGGGYPKDDVARDRIPLGARLLRIALDFHVLEVQGVTTDLAIASIRSREGRYDPGLIEVFVDLFGGGEDNGDVQEIRLRDVVPGMVFVENVVTQSGVLVIPRGQEVTPTMCERIRNFSENMEIREPVRVKTPEEQPVETETVTG